MKSYSLTDELFSPPTDFELFEKIQNHTQLKQIISHVRETAPIDVAHDLSHLCRVLSNVLQIFQQEGGDFDTLVAATLLHDLKNLPKSDAKSKSSSSLSAKHAGEFLRSIDFPKEKIPGIKDAILCHSFTVGLEPKTLEGKILQDADRLDALGAIGVARVFAVSGAMGRSIYHPKDPLGRSGRPMDDLNYSLDHFFRKLFTLADKMHTPTAQQMAYHRAEIMRQYLDVLEREMNPALETLLREI